LLAVDPPRWRSRKCTLAISTCAPIFIAQGRYLRSPRLGHARQRRRPTHSMASAAITHLVCRAQIPIAPAARPRATSRGFLPWRLSDAGPKPRCPRPRPSSAGIRNPYMSGGLSRHFLHFSFALSIFLFDLKRPSFRPDPGADQARRARSLKDGALAPPKGLSLNDRAPCYDRTIMRGAVLLELLLSSGHSLSAGPASRSMARAKIASPYIRQLRYGLPLCCMHGRSRE